jgi:predicted metal-dependent hydrolase
VSIAGSPAIDYSVRRSQRARHVRVNVSGSGEVEVVLPRSATDREAAAAVRDLRPWIDRRLARARRAHLAVAARGDTLPYLDSTLSLVRQPGRARVHRRGDELLVPAGAAAHAPLERWYRRAARAEIAARLQRACAASGTRYTSLTIRSQRTRWASCSRDGAMSFNWRLLLAPSAVLDYVVWHEVCHLEVMDHSPRFWELLERRWPPHREHARWLREHGATLSL